MQNGNRQGKHELPYRLEDGCLPEFMGINQNIDSKAPVRRSNNREAVFRVCTLLIVCAPLCIIGLAIN
jgi:hypothetical protein